jgi:hypothetical protein
MQRLAAKMKGRASPCWELSDTTRIAGLPAWFCKVAEFLRNSKRALKRSGFWKGSAVRWTVLSNLGRVCRDTSSYHGFIFVVSIAGPMPRRLPVSPRNRVLPFQDPGFTWGNFEAFFAAFLRLGPVVKIMRGAQVLEGRVVFAQRYETSGDKQNGIDIRAKVAVTSNDGSSIEEEWAFQCKHCKSWPQGKMAAAIKKAEIEFPEATCYFMLLTCDLGSKARDEAARHDRWQAWSREDITARIRSLPNCDEAARVVNTFFGPHWAEEILGIIGDGPLQASGAFFIRYLEDTPLHHHKAMIVGRTNELEALRSFASCKDKRLLILPGTGG